MRKARGDYIKVDIASDSENGLDVGYCISTIVETDFGRIGEIESVFVESNYRNRGIGRNLMKSALEWMDDRKVDRKILGVVEGNEGVYEFYRRFGFYPKSTKLEQK